MSRRWLWQGTRVALLLLAALGGLALGLWWRGHQQPRPAAQAVIAFLDVGDGDCTLIRTVSGATILLDTGSAETAPAVVRALHRFHVRTLDLLVVASPDAKSLGGVPAVLDAFPTRAAWVTGAQSGGAARVAALEAIGRHRVPARTVYAGDHLQIGAATFWAALWPPATGPRAHLDSVVYELNFGATRFVFAGPARAEEEAFLISARGEAMGCDDGSCTDLVLQAAAGGADGTASDELLTQAAPALVVVSCSAQNPPAPGVLHRLGASGAALWRTDTQGTVIVLTDGREAPTVTAARL